MSQDLLTIGEFAQLAETTKRTALWYEEVGLLKPKEINPDTGYRLYSTDQIIDLKAIMLLRRLDIPLVEIKKRGSLEKLFDARRGALKKEIEALQLALKETEKYYANFRKSGTLVDPMVKQFKSCQIYYLSKTGPYKDIDKYYAELRSYFTVIPKGTLGLTVYEGFGGYQPRKAHVKVSFIVKPGLKLKEKASVQTAMIPAFKALSYTHRGSTKFLSMLWKELEKYQAKFGYTHDTSLNFEDLELSQSSQITEMIMPIK